MGLHATFNLERVDAFVDKFRKNPQALEVFGTHEESFFLFERIETKIEGIFKAARVGTAAAIGVSALSEVRNHTVCIDILGQFTKSCSGFNYTLVTVDHLSVGSKCVPVKISKRKRMLSLFSG